MDSESVVILVVLGIYAVLGVGMLLRELFFSKKEKMRKTRTEGLVNGKEVAQRMLEEAGVEGVTIKPKDAVIQRYYYNPRKKQLVISSHACYNSGLYEVMRAATTASNAIQREEGFGMIDLYLWLAPVMEWLARLMPLFLIVILIVIDFNPLFFGVLAIAIWLLAVVFALLMHPVDKDAAHRSVEWLVSNGIVTEDEHPQLKRIGRYLTNYNLVMVLTAGFVLIGLRQRMRSSSDKTV